MRGATPAHVHCDRSEVPNVSTACAGTALASCSSDKVVRIWQKSSVAGKGWRCSVLLEDTHTKSIRCCCWSPSGTHLASASFDGTTSVWAVQQGVWEEVRSPCSRAGHQTAAHISSSSSASYESAAPSSCCCCRIHPVAQQHTTSASTVDDVVRSTAHADAYPPTSIPSLDLTSIGLLCSCSSHPTLTPLRCCCRRSAS